MLENRHKSSSHVQRQVEAYLFQQVRKLLAVELESNAKISLSDDGRVYMQPDFYAGEYGIVGEIFAHVGAPRKAQNNKIANDILKMLLLEKVTGKPYRKIIVVCDQTEQARLEGKSVLAESIRRFGIEIIMIDIDDTMRHNILTAQKLQKMTNAE